MAISRKGYLVINPRKILLYLRGEKEHTSKRVSIIAPDNAISKAKLCDELTISVIINIIY